MAENVPPSSAAHTQTNTANADQPGRPYYESLRAALRQTLAKKRDLDRDLARTEEEIFRLEGNYLEETAASGNIVRGFDGWVKGVQVGGRGGDARRGRARDEDRIFSRSSVSWMRAQEGPDSNTPSHAPTPTGSFAPQLSARDSSNANTPASTAVKAGNKKKRPTEKDEEEDGKANKRGKVTYARD